MQFKPATNLNFNPRTQFAHIFVEGFYTWINVFSKDKAKLKQAFAHSFLLEYFYVAVDENSTIAAITACTQSGSPIKLHRPEFVKALGLIRGNIAYFMLNRHMIRNAYPIPIDATTGYIEFVATAPEFQRRGAAHSLISHIMANTPHDAYILEVADTNTNAVKLYEKLGFKEIKRIKAPRGSGVNFFLYLRCAGCARRTADTVETSANERILS